MEVNGAAIATDKCWWYLVDFVWNGGKWKYQDAQDGRTLKVRDKTNTIVNLKYLPCKKARKMVGVFLSPEGNQIDQLTDLREKAKSWAGKIRASPSVRPGCGVDSFTLSDPEGPRISSTRSRYDSVKGTAE